MDAQPLYDRYHRLIVTMAEQPGPAPEHTAGAPLRQVLAQFDRDARGLSAHNDRWLRNELAGQLEERLNRTTNAHARQVYALALKHFE
jgi:hypothetical protein